MGLFNKTNQVISYTIDKNFSENVAISVVDGQVAISAPWYVSNKKINQVVLDKKNWILQKLAEYEEKNNAKKSLLEKKAIKVFGEDYNLKISYKLIRSPELNIENKIIFSNLPVKYRNVDNTKIVNTILEKFSDMNLSGVDDNDYFYMFYAYQDFCSKYLDSRGSEENASNQRSISR